MGRQQLPWDKLVKAANYAEAKARIHNNQQLDQCCPKEKRPLKLTLKDSNELSSEKTMAAPLQQKSAVSPQFEQATEKGPRGEEEELASQRT